MSEGKIVVYCGEGRGKTSSALGQAVYSASEGETATIIQFLKKKNHEEISFLSRLEPEIRLFRFEKAEGNFDNLSEEEKAEECVNIKNGMNFAKKVLVTGESTILVLDEVLGLVNNNIISIEELTALLECKDENAKIYLTGIHMPQKLVPYVDEIYEIKEIKG